MSEDKRQHHIQCRVGDIAPVVLLPGDPARATAIAGHLKDASLVAENREFRTFTGTYNGVPVSVTSTGIGCPSTAIAVEELVKVGAETLVRVGTCGSMTPTVVPGDVIVGSGAIRDEGTGRAYLPIEFPAIADLDVAASLRGAASARGLRVHTGVLHSKDSFYAQKEPSRMPIAPQLEERWRSWVAGGALGSEMESSTLFLLGSVLRVRTGSICLVASSHDASRRLTPEQTRDATTAVVESALDGLATLPVPERPV